jgi:hypothetical protein
MINQDQVISAISFLVLATLTALWLMKRAKLRRARNWPTVLGRIDSTSVTLKSGGGQPGSAAYYAEVKYSYTVQEQTYFGSLRRRFILKGRADKWVETYSKAKVLTVRYDPQKIKDSVLLENDQAPTVAPVSIRSIIIFAAVLCLPATIVIAQAASADYTNDLPSVERVKAEIKGSDATDTLARQVAVFTNLQSYIDRIKYNRTVRGNFTPGETRMRGAYSVAAYQISQDYSKSHTPAETDAFGHLYGKYEMSTTFYDDWSKRLIGPQTTTAYKGAEASLAATGQKRHEQAMDDYKRDSAAQQAADKQIFGSQGLSNDPTAVATRRCLELGGSNVGCMGKGFGAGFMDLFGLDKILDSTTGPGGAGVILLGLYKNPATTATLSFHGNVSLEGCGKLVLDSHKYTMNKRTGSLQVTVENDPHPFVLTMRPGGAFGGPGLTDVKGKIIIGYHTETTTWTHSDGSYAGTTSAQVADYAPATARCSIDSLAPPPPPKPAPASTQPADGPGMMGLVTGLTDMFSTGGGAQDGGGGGLRMMGKYGGGMLLLDFSNNSLILDCGQAHVRATYSVENAPNTFLVHVQNPGSPFTLALQPDNSLRGAGSTIVNGKLVTGMTGENITFAPHSETCDVGTFHPQTGAATTTSVATASPAPAPAATASVARVSATSPLAGSDMTVAISTSFPDGINPLAGRVVQLMSERFDIALRKVGAPIPEGTTPGQALQAYSNNCPPPTGCPAAGKLMHPYYVGKAILDSTGKVTLTVQVPPGSYYIFCSANTAKAAMVWDLPITLKAGGNAIALSTTNAEIVK